MKQVIALVLIVLSVFAWGNGVGFRAMSDRLYRHGPARTYADYNDAGWTALASRLLKLSAIVLFLWGVAIVQISTMYN